MLLDCYFDVCITYGNLRQYGRQLWSEGSGCGGSWVYFFIGLSSWRPSRFNWKCEISVTFSNSKASVFLLVLLFGAISSTGKAQVDNIDQRIAACAAGLTTTINGALKGKIGQAYEESDVVGDNFVLDQLGSIFKDATPAERIELFKIYTECLKSERGQSRASVLEYPEPSAEEMLSAHLAQVSPLALQLMPVTDFEKGGCSVIANVGYECSYRIRAGGFGSASSVVNTFSKIGTIWIIRYR